MSREQGLNVGRISLRSAACGYKQEEAIILEKTRLVLRMSYVLQGWFIPLSFWLQYPKYVKLVSAFEVCCRLVSRSLVLYLAMLHPC